MSIKRYIAEKDTTITNAYKADLTTTAENVNLGGSDSLEVFSIYGQASENSLEKSRVLVQFPVNSIADDRSKSKIPASGSVKFFLKMFNAIHPFSVPSKFTINIYPINEQWDEGIGQDMETYLDNGWNELPNGSGCTWRYAVSGTTWSIAGGAFDESSSYSQYFEKGLEDLEIDITPTVEDWLSNNIDNYGVLLKLSGSQEDGTEFKSYYTKKFYASSTNNFYYKPCIEARWAAVVTDDRNNFYVSSSALTSEDNIMNLYFFNKPRGALKNIANNVLPNIKFYVDSNLSQEISSSYKVISNPLNGVYKAQVAIETTASTIYDKWYNTSSQQTYFNGEFDTISSFTYDNNNDSEYIINITNLKSSYSTNEQVKFNIFSRFRNWSPNIYTIANSEIENQIINNLYYKIFRLTDNYNVIDYSTGSLAFSKTSYDSQGNYFELDMSLLEPKYGYGIKLATFDGANLKEFSTTYKFRVE